MERTGTQTILSVDTGGTFTDLIAVDETGLRTWKLPSTVATNALLVGKGAPLCLVVTEGFADLLLIGRQNRPRLYALHPERRPPLVLRECVVEVPERIGPDGAVEIPLSEEIVAEIARRVRLTRCESVALCLLHAYANPSHEEMIAETLRREGLKVLESFRIIPVYRDFSCALLVRDGETRPLPGKCALGGKRGDRIVIETPGGGGWGPREDA